MYKRKTKLVDKYYVQKHDPTHIGSSSHTFTGTYGDPPPVYYGTSTSSIKTVTVPFTLPTQAWNLYVVDEQGCVYHLGKYHNNSKSAKEFMIYYCNNYNSLISTTSAIGIYMALKEGGSPMGETSFFELINSGGYHFPVETLLY